MNANHRKTAAAGVYVCETDTGRTDARAQEAILILYWGLCDRACLVLGYKGRYGLGGVVLLFILGSNLGGVGPVRGLRGGGEKGVV
jgi:hypothetical protein